MRDCPPVSSWPSSGRPHLIGAAPQPPPRSARGEASPPSRPHRVPRRVPPYHVPLVSGLSPSSASAGHAIQPAPDCEHVSTSPQIGAYMVRRPHMQHVQPPERSQLRIIARRPRGRSPRTSPRVRGRLYNIILSSVAQVTHHDRSDRPTAAAFLPIHSPHASAKKPRRAVARRGECVRCQPSWSARNRRAACAQSRPA